MWGKPYLVTSKDDKSLPQIHKLENFQVGALWSFIFIVIIVLMFIYISATFDLLSGKNFDVRAVEAVAIASVSRPLRLGISTSTQITLLKLVAARRRHDEECGQRASVYPNCMRIGVPTFNVSYTACE